MATLTPPRRRLSVLTASLLAIAALTATGASAHTEIARVEPGVTATPPGTYGLPQEWGVQGYMQDGGTLNHSEVQALTESRGMMFVGGNFARVQKGSAATGDDRIEQPYLAAFDINTAAFAPSFRPTFNDEIHTLATLPDGTVLAGGAFTVVNGVPAHGIVALDPLTGQIATHWTVRLEQRTSNPLIVRDIEVAGDKVFIAGQFTHVAGATGGFTYARNLVQVTTTNPRANAAFRPHPDKVVWSVAISPDGSRLYLAGLFDRVVNSEGQPVTATKVTTVYTSNGQQPTGMAAPTFSATRSRVQQAVEAVGDRVYHGGAQHMLFGVDAATFQRRSSSITERGGDFQVVEAVTGGVILAGCHCWQYNYQDATTWPRLKGYTRKDRIKYVGAWDAATGAYLPEFVPIGVRTRNSHGAWAIEQASNGSIWVGGDFTGIQMEPGKGTQWTGGFFRLPGEAPPGEPPPPPGDGAAQTFTGADGAAWPAPWSTGAATGLVDIQGNEGRLHITDTTGAYARASLDDASTASPDVELLLSYRWDNTTARSSFNVFVRGTGGWQNPNRPRNGYGLNFVSDTSRVTVQKNVNGVLTNIAGAPGAQPVGTGKRWVRLRVVGDQLMFRTWADGQPEPGTWAWSGADSSLAGPGGVFLTHVRVAVNTAARSVFVDDLTVSAVTP